MPSNINTVLADCEQQAKTLVDEIGRFKAAGVLGEQAAKSLSKLSDVQRETSVALEKALEATQKLSTVEILASLERLTAEVANSRNDAQAADQKLERTGKRVFHVAVWAAVAGTVAAIAAIICLFRR